MMTQSQALVIDEQAIAQSEPIGYRLSIDGSRIPLYYAEMKVKGNKYHVIRSVKLTQNYPSLDLTRQM